VSRLEITNSRWREIKDTFPDGKHFRSYPSIKIGRFAVSSNYQGHDIGSLLMDLLKDQLIEEQSSSAFRFITVDAYISAIPFYEKNGFKLLKEKDENEYTRLMFFDMMDI
jgi:GNAT superfamily N-acetyltransferase